MIVIFKNRTPEKIPVVARLWAASCAGRSLPGFLLLLFTVLKGKSHDKESGKTQPTNQKPFVADRAAYETNIRIALQIIEGLQQKIITWEKIIDRLSS